MPSDAVAWDLNAGTASYKLTNYSVPDFHAFANNVVAGTPHVDGVVTFDLRWGPVTKRRTVDDPTDPQRYQVDYLETRSSMVWHGATASENFTFQSDPTPDALYAAFGKERNGAFYGKPSAFFAPTAPGYAGNSVASHSRRFATPNTSAAGQGSPIGPIGFGLTGLTVAAAAAFLRRRERLMAEASRRD